MRADNYNVANLYYAITSSDSEIIVSFFIYFFTYSLKNTRSSAEYCFCAQNFQLLFDKQRILAAVRLFLI
ncbi:hypothetical protein CAL7102_02709 [Dulcicalothrix desertica PCC 7102]|nr:hypothetical protein CAL7102_02709 [Dulcicalothrix desertica PCC 7102]